MKKILFLIALISLTNLYSQTNEQQDKDEILSILDAQANAWSSYNIEEFMEGYWKNDSLKFYGASGLTYGWENTLSNYKKRYPSKEHTGILNFKINDISKINDDAYYVMGAYFLKRSVGNANGVFMIIFKKINDEWKIIADTSC
jgi:hypothetical protein